MNDIKHEAQGLERYGIKWNGPDQPMPFQCETGYWTPWHVAQAVIDQLRAEREILSEGFMKVCTYVQAGDFAKWGDNCHDALIADHKKLRERVAELERQLIEFEWFKLNNELLSEELAATKEHLNTVEPEFHSLQATRNMAEKTVEIMIRRAESAEAELAAPKADTQSVSDDVMDALVDALEDAATSLRTISEKTGRDEYLEDAIAVRGYANSRYRVANEALATYRAAQEGK